MKKYFTIIACFFLCIANAQITLVKDINAGASFAGGPQGKCVYNGFVYFRANNLNGGFNVELWRSDGTDAGTTMVKDINAAAGGSNPNGMIVFNNKLFFSADNGVNGRELWVSDGTGAGTLLLKDIVSGINSSMPADFVVFNNALYFTVTNTVDPKKFAIWKTDGTAAGTVVVKDINTVTQFANILKLCVSGNKLFFWAVTDATGSGTLG